MNTIWYNDQEDLSDVKLKKSQYCFLYVELFTNFITSRAILPTNFSSELKESVKIMDVGMEECSISSIKLFSLMWVLMSMDLTMSITIAQWLESQVFQKNLEPIWIMTLNKERHFREEMARNLW